MNIVAQAEAATDRNPTPAQKIAGNYAKGKCRIHGLTISIENPRSSIRTAKDGSWKVRMPCAYGYLLGTEGADSDHVDAFIGPHHKSPLIYVVDQNDADTGEFDEGKVFIGFATPQQVKNTYNAAFSDGRGKDRLGKITELTVAQFKKWLRDGDTTVPYRASGGRLRRADGGAFGVLSPAEQAEVPPSALDKVVAGGINSLATLPQRAIENSQYSLDTGNYDPSVPLETAMTMVGGSGLVPAEANALRSGITPRKANLPMDDASRMARAKEQGYNINEPVYHETNADFKEFKPAYGSQVWFTTDKETLGQNGAAGQGRVIEAFLKTKKLAGWPEYERYGTDQLISMGYDGARLGKDVVIFDPKAVRSVEARFDPRKSKSGNLLASGAGLGLVGSNILEYEERAFGGRVAMADGGTPVTDPDLLAQLNGGAPKPVTDPAILAQLNGPAPEKPSGLQNMWNKATPGGPLWLIKQAVEGARGAVQSSADVMSEPTTEEGAYFQNQGREKGPGYAMQAAQVLTPAAPGGTGGILAAPFRAAEEAAAPVAAANRSAAEEFGINLSKGQSTQDLDRIRYEDMASRGAYGKEAQDRAATFFQKQFEDSQAAGQSVGQQTARAAPVMDNPGEAAGLVNAEVAERAGAARTLQTEAERQAAQEAEAQRGIVSDQGRTLQDAIRGGAQSIENPREAGEIVGQNVRDAASANRADFRARYDEFGRLPGEFRADAVKGMGTRVRNELTYGETPVVIDDLLTPSASRAIQALDQISVPRIQNRANPHAEPSPSEIAAVSLKGVDQMRKQLVAYYQAARSSGNAADIRATREVMNGFDGEIERAISEGLFSGDPRALAALQEARASYSRYQRTFTPQGAGDDIGTAMRRIVDRNATPEEISNMIIGSGKIGSAGLPVRIADRLENILGADSDSWSAIRQAMWQKASQMRNPAGEIDPVKSANNIAEFAGSSLAQRMFTQQERAAMRAHANGVRDLDRIIETMPATERATQARNAYQQVFGGEGLAGAPASAFKRIVEGVATPEETSNAIFKVIGSGNPGNAARVLQAIERIVGPESETMAAVRQGVWQKLTQAAAGKDQPGAQKAMQAINEFLNGTGKTIAEQLYSEKELALMGRYANALKLMIIPKYARTNSDTAPALLAAVRKYGSMVMGALGFAHGDGGLTGMGVGKLLEMGANRLEGATQRKRLNDSLDDIIAKPSAVLGERPRAAQIVRKSAPFAFGPRIQGVVGASAQDENKKSPRVGQQ